jgi:hypothetical protein
MKTTSLKKLIDHQNAIKKSKDKSYRIDGIKAIPANFSEDQVIEIFKSYKDARVEEENLRKTFMKIPLAKRNECEALHKWLKEYGINIAKIGGDYSGNVSHYVYFGDNAGAGTVTGDGGKYSRSCQYSKISADHCVTFNYNNAHILKKNEDLVNMSKKDYLYLIELIPLKSGTFKATWVRTKGKQIVSESGWVARMGDMMYHSTTSEEHCMSALKRKFKIAKTQSREAIMERIKHSETLKLADIRRITGWCQAGCKAWLDRYMDGKTSAKSEEVIEAAKKSDGYYEKKLLELIA